MPWLAALFGGGGAAAGGAAGAGAGAGAAGAAGAGAAGAGAASAGAAAGAAGAGAGAGAAAALPAAATTILSALGQAGTQVGHGLSSAIDSLGNAGGQLGNGLTAGLQGGGVEAQHIAALGQPVPQGVNFAGPSSTFTGDPAFAPQSPSMLTSLGQGFGNAARMYGQLPGELKTPSKPPPIQPHQWPSPLAAPPAIAMPQDDSLAWLRAYSLQGGF